MNENVVEVPQNSTTHTNKMTIKERRIFVCAILTEALDSREPLKKELVKVKNRIAKALGTDKIMLQTV